MKTVSPITSADRIAAGGPRAALEPVVGNPAAHKSAGDAENADQQAPVTIEKFGAGLVDFCGKNIIPVRDAIAENAGGQPDERDQQHQFAGENFFQQVERGQVGCASGRRMRRACRRCGKFASSGESLMSHNVQSTQTSMMTAGMKNTAQVASARWPFTVTLVANTLLQQVMKPTARGISFCQFNNPGAPVEGKINADGNQRAENRAEHAAFADMKPVGFDFDDGNRAVALEIHVDRVERGIGGDACAFAFCPAQRR